MDNRLKLQDYLETLCPNVYFQPPSDMKMQYPAITYNRASIDKTHANNLTYILNHEYDITVMDWNPDSQLAAEILNLPYSSFDRQYVVNGLNHTTLSLYY